MLHTAVAILLFEYLPTVTFQREIVNSKNFIDWLNNLWVLRLHIQPQLICALYY